MKFTPEFGVDQENEKVIKCQCDGCRGYKDQVCVRKSNATSSVANTTNRTQLKSKRALRLSSSRNNNDS